MSTTDLLTVDEVAALLAVNPVTVRRRMDRGEFGDIYRDGRKCVRITRVGYEKYMASRVEAPSKAKEYTCMICGYSQVEKFATCPECGEER